MRGQKTQATNGSGDESSSQLSVQDSLVEGTDSTDGSGQSVNMSFPTHLSKAQGPSGNQAGTVPRNVRVRHSAGSRGNQGGNAPRNGRVRHQEGTRRNQAGNALRNVQMHHPADSTGGNQAGNALRNINTPPSKGSGLCILCRTADIPIETNCPYDQYDGVVILHEPKHALVPSDKQLTRAEYAVMYADIPLKWSK